MVSRWLSKFRFRLSTLFVLVLGIAIGYSLNIVTLQLLTGVAAYPTQRPAYVIEPPDVLSIVVKDRSSSGPALLTKQALVAMDGRVAVGSYGTVYVAGMTIPEAQAAVENLVRKQVQSPAVSVDVWAYNSKVYYVVVTDPAGDQVLRCPITGNETVLDAIAQLGGLKEPEKTQVKIVRPAPNGVGREKVIPLDWEEVSGGGWTLANYKMWPGDRVVVSRKAGAGSSSAGAPAGGSE